MKRKKLIGILATSTLLLSSVAMFAACGGGNHTIERVEETQATCTEGGHAAYYKCTDDGCDKLFSDIEGKHEITWDDVEKTDPLGHNMTKVDAKDASCTEDGAKEHYHCERCENDFKDEAGATAETDAAIPALGHDMKVVDKVIPVTGHPGVREHYRCEREDNQEYFDSFGDKKVTDENRHELEYNMLEASSGGWQYNADYSHTNDADPYVTIPSSDGLNVATSEYYTDIAYTARVQKAKVNKQFIALTFENKSIYSISVNDGKVSCDSEMSGWDLGQNQGYTYLNDEWDGYTLTAGEQDSYEGDGLEVTLARTGKTVKVLVDGHEVHSVTLDEYETTLVKGGMIVFDAIPEVKYYFHVEPQAIVPAAPQVTVAPVDAAQGAVTLNQETFAHGDELVITVTPTDGYVFDYLTVNGREITSLTDGTYTTTATSIVNISVVFKVKEFGSVNASVTGKRYGVTGNSIAANAAFELVGRNQKYTGTLTDGKLVLDEALVNEYTLKIAGYIPVTISVEKGNEYAQAIALEYDMFTDYGWYKEALDFTHQNDADPYVTVENSDGVNFITKNGYDQAAITVTVGKDAFAGERAGVMMTFGDKMLWFTVKNANGSVTFEWWGMANWEKEALVPDVWGFDGNTLTAADTESWNNNTMTLTLVRNGKEFYAFVNGEFRTSLTVNGYETQKVQPGVRVWMPVETQWGATVEEDISDYIEASLVLNTPAHGGVSASKTEGVVFGEEITLTFTPDEGYRVKTLKVNGVDVTEDIRDNTYRFLLKNGENTVVTEFEEIPYTTIAADIKGKKHGTANYALADDTAVQLVGRTTLNATVENGKITLANVPTGRYAVKSTGYLDGTIVVTEDAYETEIVLEYSMFTMLHTDNGDEGYWNLTGTKNDFTHQNDANAVLGVAEGSNGMWVAYTNDSYNNLHFTVTFKAGNSYNDRKAIQLAFDDGKGIQFGLQKDGDGISFGYWYQDRFLLNKGAEARLTAEEKIGNLTAAQLTKFGNEGIAISVVRNGNKVAFFVDGNLVRTVEVASEYETKKCTPAIIIEWAAAQNIGVAVSETLPDFETPTFTLTQGQNGTVTKTSGDSYSVWEKITLTIAPESNYRLKQLTVNGVVISGDKTEYSFFPVAGENTVVAEFEQIPYGSISADVTGKKHGVSGNAITNGTKITLIGADNVKYEPVVTNGKISIDNMIAGTYTVKLDGYLDSTITVAEGTAYETAIVLEYNIITVLPGMWYDNVGDCLRLDHMNDAENPYFVSVQNGVEIVTADSYEDLLFSIKIKHDEGSKYYMYFLFDDNKYVMTTLDQRNGSSHFELCSWVEQWDFEKGRENLLRDIWTGYDFNTEEQAAYNGDGITISIYRKGANIYALVGNKLVYSQALDNAYATKQVRAGTFIVSSVPNGNYYFNVDDEPAVDLSATVTVTTPQNGTVTPNKTTAVYGEEITLSITPDSGYRIKSVTVNGSVLQTNNGVYKFNAKKENTVAVEFELITYGSLDATLTGKKHGASGSAIEDGTEIKLVGPREYTVVVTDGKLTLTQIETGTYAVKLDGYFDGTITVVSDSKYETEIMLEYNFMKGTGWYNDQQDLSHVNDVDAYVTLKADAADSMIHVSTVKEYDDVAITVTFGKDMRGNNNLVGPTLIYGNKFLTVTVQASNKAFEISGYESWWGMGSIAPNEWKSVNMTDEEWTAYENNTLQLTLVKSGKNVYLFVGDTLRLTKEVDTEQKAHAGIMGADTVRQIDGKPVEWHFKVEEDISAYLAQLPTE